MGKLVDNLLRHLKRDYKQLIKGFLIILIIVTLLKVIFYLTPKEVQSSLILERNKPNLLTMWSNHFIHFDETHLRGNIEGFLISSTSLLIVLFFTKNIKLFYKLLILNLTIIPILLSSGWLFLSKVGLRIAGFSGVVASLFGSLLLCPLIILNILGIKLNIDLFTLWVISLLISILLLRYSPIHQYFYLPRFILIIFLFILIILLFIWIFKTIEIENERKMSGIQKLLTYLFSLLSLLAVLILTFWVSYPLFPLLSVLKERPIGVGTHFIGIVTGIIVMWLIESGRFKHFQEIKEKCLTHIKNRLLDVLRMFKIRVVIYNNSIHSKPLDKH